MQMMNLRQIVTLPSSEARVPLHLKRPNATYTENTIENPAVRIAMTALGWPDVHFKAPSPSARLHL